MRLGAPLLFAAAVMLAVTWVIFAASSQVQLTPLAVRTAAVAERGRVSQCDASTEMSAALERVALPQRLTPISSSSSPLRQLRGLLQCERELSCERPEAAVLEEDEVPIEVQGVDHWSDACLLKKGDRLEVAPAKNSAASTKDGITFLASDLCAMGHTTKDPLTLLSMLLDYAETRQNQSAKLKLRVVYGNNCMSKSPSRVPNKRTPVFHSVLKGWFHAVVGGILLAFQTPESQICTSTLSCESCAAVKRFQSILKRAFNGVELTEVYYEDHSDQECYSSIFKRKERWRWVRTASHASIFRGLLHRQYHVGWNSTKKAQAPLTITLLRRDEDRHYEESAVLKHVQSLFSSLIAEGDLRVDMVAFDSIRGRKAPSHPEQLQILFETDVLVAAHGAGLASIVAMRPRTAVIELLPNNFRYPMYEELAQLSAVNYVGFESPVVWPSRCCRGSKGGDALPALPHPSYVHGVGARACKKCDVRLSAAMLEHQLRSSVNSLLLLRGGYCDLLNSSFLLLR